MIPSWVPEIPTDEQPVSPPGAAPVTPAITPPLQPVPTALPGRFTGTRRNLGSYAKGGKAADLRRGLGHYVRTGYGGAGTTARRLGGTVAGGKALYDALSSLGGGGAVTPGLDPAVLRGRSATEIMNAVIEAAMPVNGTLDREASRASTREALAELLTKYPEADLLNLTEDQKLSAVETYVACDVFHRLDLDVGKTVRDRAKSVSSAMSRLKEMRNYVRETVSAAFRQLRADGRPLTRQSMTRIINAALKETFSVFESYLK